MLETKIWLDNSFRTFRNLPTKKNWKLLRIYCTLNLPLKPLTSRRKRQSRQARPCNRVGTATAWTQCVETWRETGIRRTDFLPLILVASFRTWLLWNGDCFMLCYICSFFFQICVLPIHHHPPVLLNVLQMICRCFKNSTVPRVWDKSIWLCCPSLPDLSQTSCTCARLHCSCGFHHPLENMANLNLCRPTLCLSWIEGCN